MRLVKLEELIDSLYEPTMLIMVGAPGSGKSTFIAKLIEGQPEGYFKIHSLDTCRELLYGDANIQGNFSEVFREFQKRLTVDMDNRTHVIIDNTNARQEARNTLHKIAADKGYKVQYWLMNTTLPICLKRNKLRERQVPEAVIKSMHQSITNNPPRNKVVHVEGDKESYRFLIV